MKNILTHLNQETQYLNSDFFNNNNLEIKLANLKKNNWHRMENDIQNEENQPAFIHKKFECSIHDIYQPEFSDDLSNNNSICSDNSFQFLENEKRTYQTFLNNNKRSKSLSISSYKYINKYSEIKKYFVYEDKNDYNQDEITNPNIFNLKKKAKNTFSNFYDIEFIEQIWNNSKIKVGKTMKRKTHKKYKNKESHIVDLNISPIKYESIAQSSTHNSIAGFVDKIFNGNFKSLKCNYTRRKRIKTISESIKENDMIDRNIGKNDFSTKQIIDTIKDTSYLSSQENFSEMSQKHKIFNKVNNEIVNNNQIKIENSPEYTKRDIKNNNLYESELKNKEKLKLNCLEKNKLKIDLKKFIDREKTIEIKTSRVKIPEIKLKENKSNSKIQGKSKNILSSIIKNKSKPSKQLQKILKKNKKMLFDQLNILKASPKKEKNFHKVYRTSRNYSSKKSIINKNKKIYILLQKALLNSQYLKLKNLNLYQ